MRKTNIVNKILVILPTDSIGGAERVAHNLVSHLLTEHYEVHVYFLSRGDNGNWDELKAEQNIKLFFNKHTSEVSGLYSFFKWCICNNNSYKYVYSTHLHVNALIGLSRFLGLLKIDKHVARESTVIFDRFFGFKRYIFKLLYKFYWNVDFLIFQTEYMKNRLLSEIPNLNRVSSKVIRNPLNLEKINSLSAEKCEAKNKFNILFVGRIIPLKNLKLLIDSLATCNKLQPGKFHCYVLGDGPQKVEMIELVKSYNLSEQFSFLGNVKNPYKYMSIADLGVITSIKEGFPNVIIEMMASGTKAIITTPCAGDLDRLPKLIVTDDFSVAQLSLHIKSLINNGLDNSDDYINFANSIGTSSFWKEVEYQLCKK